MAEKSVGLVELSSIAAGFPGGGHDAQGRQCAADFVALDLFRQIHGARRGRHAAVTAAVEAGGDAAGGCLIDSFVIANLHPDVFVALGRSQPAETTGALGIIESFNVATLTQSSDTVAKTFAVQLLEVRLAMAMGGKAFCSMTGDVSSVQAGVAACRAVLAEAGVLVNAVVISRPHPDGYREVV